MSDKDLFLSLKDKLLEFDPVAWSQKYLTLDGKPYRIQGNGYRPFADLIRLIGIKSLERDSKPIVISKSRQVGLTTTTSVLEMYFLGSGLFGKNDKPPIRIIHAFPTLEIAAAYSKTKFNAMVSSSIPAPGSDGKKSSKSYMQSLLDGSSDFNNSMTFKQFTGGNHVFIESVGVDGDRIRGKTADVLFFDECFPYDQHIETINGKIKIGKIFKLFKDNKNLPLIKTFNECTNQFEYKKIVNAWERSEKELIQITIGNREIRCTPNHKFLTESGWKCASELKKGNLLKSSHGTNLHIRSLNEDQLQIMLGSFLGDGNIDSYKTGRYRLRIIHSINQKEYCEWKSQMFQTTTKLIKNNGYSNSEAISFATKSFGLEKELPSNKSSCPQWVLDNLDARGLAIWLMDDGSIKKWNKESSNITLSTCSFDEDSQIRMVNKLKLMGIESHYKFYKNKKGKGYYSIYINKDGCNKLFDIVAPYMHDSMNYKILDKFKKNKKYNWDNNFKNYSFTVVDNISYINKKEKVYDIEVEDNHNFILCPSASSKNVGGPIVHNCQDMSDVAISNTTKTALKAQYGALGGGVQVYFGTPKMRGSAFHHMWQSSSQQYYYLGCEKCKDYFPLYTPGSDEWEKIWIREFIVKCTKCGHEQDKRDAAERGKWIATKNPDECSMIGFHINQLYMPDFTKEKMLSEKPGISPVNSERSYQNEVLGEFFQGETSPITPEEIRVHCAETERKFRAKIEQGEESLVVLGLDYGGRNDMEQIANPGKVKQAGKSYTTAVVLSVSGPNILSIDFATKFKKNDMEYKKELIDQIMRTYSVDLAVGDIGYSEDFSSVMHQAYGDKYIVSRASGNKINDNIRFNQNSFPKEIQFQRDYFIMEIYEQLKKGQIKFPYGDYEKIAWLIQHCCNMEIKPTISRMGDPQIHYIKSGPNDGFMALLNAYLAYKFYITKGFTVRNPNAINHNVEKKSEIPMVLGFMKKRF